MTEPLPQPDDASDRQSDRTRTGHPPVDEVLDSLVHLADLPVAGHVAVLEAAHDRLRQSLSSDVT